FIYVTLSCCIRNRGNALENLGRKNRCYRLAVQRAFVYATKLWISHIVAASREHGMKYPTLMHNLVNVSTVGQHVLSDLAITEPKSFLSLAKLVRVRQQEGFGAALGDGKEPPGVVSCIVTLQ
uniref:Mitochondrial ribosomal protein L20 n=1 Tax=Oncorhynchus kisutch TaxID=8019 RepID=A0A8C7MCM1_ONCKI